MLNVPALLFALSNYYPLYQERVSRPLTPQDLLGGLVCLVTILIIIMQIMLLHRMLAMMKNRRK